MLHLGFSRPTPVQSQAWPAALAGHDLLCRAPTGSGKTLAYLLPAMAHAAAQRPGRPGEGPSVLVLVPTRELAMQVAGTAETLRKVSAQRCVALYGGAPRDEQVEALERTVSLCVCTTGRLLDMLMTRHADLGRVTLLVLDEADLLISLGFEDQIQQIAGQLRPDRQTLLFSATFSDRLEAAAGQWLRSPLRIYAEGGRGERTIEAADASTDGGGEGGEGGEGEYGLGSLEEGPDGVSLPPAAVSQRFTLCDAGTKRDVLMASLTELAATAAAAAAAGGAGGKARQRPRAMVFVNRIKEIKALQAALKKGGFSTASLHGEHSQRERELALTDFKAGKASVLLSTDLGARGVDIKLLAAVVNYDVPLSLAAYVHRAGRTGRQGNAGLVISLLKRDENSRHFARGAARLLALAALPADEALAALLAAELPVAGALGPQQRPALPQATGATTAAAPAAAPTAAAYAGDLLAFAADFAAGSSAAAATPAAAKKAAPKKRARQ